MPITEAIPAVKLFDWYSHYGDDCYQAMWLMASRHLIRLDAANDLAGTCRVIAESSTDKGWRRIAGWTDVPCTADMFHTIEAQYLKFAEEVVLGLRFPF